MSDIRLTNDYYHFVYDPLVHGYTTGGSGSFYTSLGTPTISTSYLRLNADGCYTIPQFMYGEYEFGWVLPAATDASLICGAAGSSDITVWDQISDGEFAVTMDGTDYDVTGIDFTGGTYTPASLTGGGAATSDIDTWAAVTDGAFNIDIDGNTVNVTGLDFKSEFPYTSGFLNCGASATSNTSTWALVTDGAFDVDIDGNTVNVTGLDFSAEAAYTPAFLTGGASATSDIDTWAALTDGEFDISIDGVAHSVTGLNFKAAFPYTSAYLTGGNAATTDVDTWAAVTDGKFDITIDGAALTVDSIDFSAVAAYTPAYLTGGISATTTIATWAAVTDGAFDIDIDGATINVTGLDFSNIAAYTPAYLTGGTGATSVIGTWNAVTDGEFTVTIDGSAHDITGINFSAAADMAGVASLIQSAIFSQAAETVTVSWSTDHFIITSSDTTSTSEISVLSAVGGGAGTDISGAGATAFMDGDAGQGTATAAVPTMTMSDVASAIQAAVRTETSSTETVVWSTDHFVITSADTTATSAITVTSAPAGGTDISGAGGTAFMDADVAAGVVTDKASLMTMEQVASKLQTEIRTKTGSSETVTWDTDHFIISSIDTTVDSEVTVTTATGGGGTDISGVGATAFMDCEVGRGTPTAHTTTKTMGNVADILETAIQAETGSTETFVWDTDHFVVSSVDTTSSSAITVTSATGGAGTDISGAGGTAFLDANVGNGTVTDRVSLMTMEQVAAVIQAGIRAETGSTETVTWSTNKFVVASVDTTVDSAVTVLSASVGGTDISGAGGTAFMDGDAGHGTPVAHVTTKDMDDVAALIQAAVRTETGLTETVVWDTDHFEITSVNTTNASEVTVTSAPAAGTDISGVGATAFMDSETGRGTPVKRAMTDAMDWVAGLIQVALVALTGNSDTVTWDTDHFVITSDNAGGVSTVSVLSAVSGGAGTAIEGAGYMNGEAGTGSVTTGTSKEWGLKDPAFADKSSILFQYFGKKLICRTYDIDGNTEYETITWNDSWTGARTSFKIVWNKSTVDFYTNGSLRVTLSTYIPNNIPLAIHLNNPDSDNADLAYIYGKGIQKMFTWR